MEIVRKHMYVKLCLCMVISYYLLTNELIKIILCDPWDVILILINEFIFNNNKSTRLLDYIVYI